MYQLTFGVLTITKIVPSSILRLEGKFFTFDPSLGDTSTAVRSRVIFRLAFVAIEMRHAPIMIEIHVERIFFLRNCIVFKCVVISISRIEANVKNDLIFKPLSSACVRFNDIS